MDRGDEVSGVRAHDVQALAHVAGLPLEPRRVPALARALEADLRAIRTLRAVDVGETYPAGVAPLPQEWAGGRGEAG